MVNLYSPRAVADLMKRHGLRTTQALGQHFLLDRNALERMVGAAELTGEEAVLEIGPGLGAMTRILAEHAATVTAVEVDAGFIGVLRETVGGLPNVRVDHADFLKLDLPTWVPENLSPLPATLVANVPYNISTPILAALLATGAYWRVIVLLVQKEVAERMRAQPNTPEYGSLSVFAQFHAAVDIAGTVASQCFFPPPKVESSIVRLRPLAEPPVAVSDTALFHRIVRASFGQRRKTLLNALSAMPEWDKDDARAALEAAGVDPKRRGETLSMAEFAMIANAGRESDARLPK
jgi:16S rRNA (adenine1518-N6/adenine1519-N6)-dimethyltransferase